MNRKIVEKIPYKEKKLLISETLLLYKRMKMMKAEQASYGDRARDFVQETMARNFKGASLIETIFSIMSVEHSLILENDFIKRLDPTWYLQEWSKTTYYKLKHEAVDEFIYLLYA